MKKILNSIHRVTSHPLYNLLVSISLIVVSVYDSFKIIMKDFTKGDFHKEHWIFLVGVFMLIHAIASLFKGIRGAEESLSNIDHKD